MSLWSQIAEFVKRTQERYRANAALEREMSIESHHELKKTRPNFPNYPLTPGRQPRYEYWWVITYTKDDKTWWVSNCEPDSGDLTESVWNAERWAQEAVAYDFLRRCPAHDRPFMAVIYQSFDYRELGLKC